MPFSYVPSEFRVGTLFSEVFGSHSFHKSVFTHKALEDLLKMHGFNIIKSCGYAYSDQSKGKLKTFRNGVNFVVPKSCREGIIFFLKRI
jgi:hypothetical protein